MTRRNNVVEGARHSQGTADVLRKLYDRLLALAGSPFAARWLAVVAFIDGSVFTLPPELLQLPMSIARPQRALRYAAIGTIASSIGAVVAYAIGASLFEAVAVPLLRFLGREAEFAVFSREVAGNALLWPVTFLLAPMPAAVAAGSLHLGLPFALLASVIGRGSRFFVVALLLKRFGASAARMIEHHFHRVALVAVALLAGFVVVRYAL
ncbi:MAG: YqaA family protein [Janthinobacterium lividum]